MSGNFEVFVLSWQQGNERNVIFLSHVGRMLAPREPVSSLFRSLSNATRNWTCCCSSNGWYRGEQDTADQEVPVKGHTRVE